MGERPPLHRKSPFLCLGRGAEGALATDRALMIIRLTKKIASII